MAVNLVEIKDIGVHCEEGESKQVVRVVLINSPKTANAFSAEIMISLKEVFENIDENIRLVILSGKGKHYSAGANLEWMKASASMAESENIEESKKLTEMFEALDQVRVPVISVIRGAAFGGALGLIAASDYAVATESAKFCLSETRLGLLPAVILPYLSRKMRAGQLRRMGLSARVFQSEMAKEVGLVEVSCRNDDLIDVLTEECNQLLSSGPKAQAIYKELHQQILSSSHAQDDRTLQAIAKARKSPEGQDGLNAFFSKTKASYCGSISEGLNEVFS